LHGDGIKRNNMMQGLLKRPVAATLSVEYDDEMVAEIEAQKMLNQIGQEKKYVEPNDDFAPEEEEDDEEEDQEEEAEQIEEEWICKPDYLDPSLTLAGQTHPEQYKRPPTAAAAIGGDDGLTFQHVETTYDIDHRSHEPVIRLWGVTEQGNSVLVEDRTFRPYFYAAVSTEQETQYLSRRLEAMLKEKFHTIGVVKKKAKLEEEGGWIAKPLEKYVISMDVHYGVSMSGYHPPEQPRTRMVKITLAYPRHVAAARDALEQAVFGRRYVTYEGNVPFELRYMIDRGIHGCQWIHLDPDAYEVVPFRDCQSTAQIEVHIKKHTGIRALAVEERGDIAPMRIMSYDLEVLRKERGFPTADRDTIIMITCALHVVGQQPVDKHRVCFALKPKSGGGGTFQSFPDADIYVFDNERDLLMAWRQYVLDCDPDALTGWNTDNFDAPYMAGRAAALGIFKEFMSFGRLHKKKCWIREAKFESKAHGARVSKELLCEGRFSYDGLLFLLRGVELHQPNAAGRPEVGCGLFANSHSLRGNRRRSQSLTLVLFKRHATPSPFVGQAHGRCKWRGAVACHGCATEMAPVSWTRNQNGLGHAAYQRTLRTPSIAVASTSCHGWWSR
jgi:hypothetical protein